MTFTASRKGQRTLKMTPKLRSLFLPKEKSLCVSLLSLVCVCVSQFVTVDVCTYMYLCDVGVCVCRRPERRGGKFMSECFCHRHGNYGSF